MYKPKKVWGFVDLLLWCLMTWVVILVVLRMIQGG